ncbi:hypothetical protein ACQCSX_22020 (plasmid) [Pseudarthrobacter sp. P1]|uniref:hypothetical protein n=1 Tax=Pseudarthrobacter sp. P1 TaxID=3418418 RepID=UPI003CF083D5
MTILQARAPRGIPSGGQFTSNLRAEPLITLAPANPADMFQPKVQEPPYSPGVRENLRRSVAPATPITEEQAEHLRRHRTPLTDAMDSRGVTSLPSTEGADAAIRTIQQRLRGRGA